MKLVATILVAAFLVAGGMSMAFADCAGHNKAQLVQSGDSPMLSDQQANNNEARVAVPEKVAQQTKNAKSLEKK